MKLFCRNVFRLARQNKGSFIGAVLIIAIGIFVYIAMMDTLRNLEDQVDSYYESNGMADVFAEVSGISDVELQRIADLQGIDEVSGKMAEDVRMLAAGQKELVTVHLLSYDEDDVLNQLTLSSALNNHDALYLGDKMSAIYKYETGEPITLLWNGSSVDFSLMGTCNAPNYIYSIPPGGAMLPDGEVYDIACIEKSRMEELTGRYDSLNELGFTLSPGFDYDDVRYRLTESLQPYGLISLTPKEDQVSANMLNGEISELISIGTVLPLIFMSISIFMLYVVLKKMIDRDQTLIGTMKAFGMTDGEMIGAYMVEGAVVGLAGAVLGSVLAAPFGKAMFEMYAEFFNLPDTVYHNYYNSRINALVFALGTGLLSVFLGVREILSIVPAQAMRAKTPKDANGLHIPNFLTRHLGSMERMGIRSVTRNLFRGFLIVLAIAFPFSMSSVLMSFDEVADQMFLDQFEKVQVYDLQLSLDQYTSPLNAAQSGEFLDGVKAAEAVCTIPAEFRNDNLSEFSVLYGLNRGSEMWKIMDMSQNYYEPPQQGVILNHRIAEKLHVEAGDIIEISCAKLAVDEVSLPVVDVIEESLGSGCYISLDSFSRFFNTESAANTVLLTAEPGRLDDLKELLRDANHVTCLVDAEKINTSYKDTLTSMLAMVSLFLMLSAVAGAILIYNISMINIRERSSEFGTLMVLGASNKEISRILLFEQMLYFILGILAGIPGSFGVKRLIEDIVISDTYKIRMTVSIGSYCTAFLICLVITILACAAGIRYVRKIELTEVLKGRE